jgi:hypothetical protein
VRRGREAGHVGADLGQDHLRGDRSNPGNGIQSDNRWCQLADLLIDAGLHGGEVSGGRIHAVQQLGQQEGVMVGAPAGQRLGQAAGLGSQAAAGEVGQHRRIPLAGDQCSHDRPARGAEGVADHHRKFDQRVLEQLLHPLLLRRAHGQQVHPVTRQITQLPNLGRGDEAGAQHLPFGEWA